MTSAASSDWASRRWFRRARPFPMPSPTLSACAFPSCLSPPSVCSPLWRTLEVRHDHSRTVRVRVEEPAVLLPQPCAWRRVPCALRLRRCPVKAFEYVAPKTKEQAVGLLASNWGQAEVLAG